MNNDGLSEMLMKINSSPYPLTPLKEHEDYANALADGIIAAVDGTNAQAALQIHMRKIIKDRMNFGSALPVELCTRCGKDLRELGPFKDFAHYRADVSRRTICVD